MSSLREERVELAIDHSAIIKTILGQTDSTR